MLWELDEDLVKFVFENPSEADVPVRPLLRAALRFSRGSLDHGAVSLPSCDLMPTAGERPSETRRSTTPPLCRCRAGTLLFFHQDETVYR